MPNLPQDPKLSYDPNAEANNVIDQIDQNSPVVFLSCDDSGYAEITTNVLVAGMGMTSAHIVMTDIASDAKPSVFFNHPATVAQIAKINKEAGRRTCIAMDIEFTQFGARREIDAGDGPIANGMVLVGKIAEYLDDEDLETVDIAFWSSKASTFSNRVVEINGINYQILPKSTSSLATHINNSLKKAGSSQGEKIANLVSDPEENL